MGMLRSLEQFEGGDELWFGRRFSVGLLFICFVFFFGFDDEDVVEMDFLNSIGEECDHMDSIGDGVEGVSEEGVLEILSRFEGVASEIFKAASGDCDAVFVDEGSDGGVHLNFFLLFRRMMVIP